MKFGITIAEDHEYFNIPEIKILFRCDFRGKTFFPNPQMLIYAN